MAHQVFTCEICGHAVKAHGNKQSMFFYHHYTANHPEALKKAKEAYHHLQEVMKDVGLLGNLDDRYLGIGKPQ